MKRSKRVRRVLVSADGHGVVSHAGVGLLREMAEYTGLVEGVTDALLDTYKGPPIHAPGRVFTDLAVAVADGADAISGISVLVDRQDLFGAVASMPTTWRVMDRIDATHLTPVQQARARARARAWSAGAGPDLSQELCLDFDATITIAHSEKENAAATWKKTFGFHPLLCFLDRPMSPAGRHSRGCCGRATLGRTPPPITSRCWTWLWRRCLIRPVLGPATPRARGCWPAAIRPVRRTRSRRHVRSVGSGSPSDSLWT